MMPAHRHFEEKGRHDQDGAGADQAGPDIRGLRAILTGEAACQKLVHGGADRAAHQQQRRPLASAAARTDDDQRARETRDNRAPAMKADFLAQKRTGQAGDDQRSGKADRRRRRERELHQAGEIKQRR